MACIGLVRDGACRKESILVIISNILKRRALVCGSVRFSGSCALSLDLFRGPLACLIAHAREHRQLSAAPGTLLT
jgi:hypothetical protein